MNAIRVKKLNPNAVLPTYGSIEAAGADLLAAIQGGNPSVVQAVTYVVGVNIPGLVGEHTAKVLYKNAAGEISLLFEFTFTVVEAQA